MNRKERSHLRRSLLRGISAALSVLGPLRFDAFDGLKEMKQRLPTARPLEGSLAEAAFWTRSGIRQGHAWIEGTVYAVGRLALSLANEQELQFTDGLEELIEASPKCDPGRVRRQLPKRFATALAALAEATASEVTLDRSGEDWKRFLHLVKYRNRIAHPASSSHLLPDERAGLTTAAELLPFALEWFERTTLEHLREAVTSLGASAPRSLDAPACGLGDPPRADRVEPPRIEQPKAGSEWESLQRVMRLLSVLGHDTRTAMGRAPVDFLVDRTRSRRARIELTPRSQLGFRRLAWSLLAHVEGMTWAAAGHLERMGYEPRSSSGGIFSYERYAETVELFSATFGHSRRVDRSDGGWTAVRYALELRDRLTHPKTRSDLRIGPDVPGELLKAAGWLVATYDAWTLDVKRCANRQR